MKTAVIIKRDLNGVGVRQDSKTKYFNANDLLEIHNINSETKKRIQFYFDNVATKEYMNELVKEENLNSGNSSELKKPYYSKRGKYGGTWMHPYLFIDFAMWLSPKFKLKVVRWVYDNLIKYRNEAGNTFKDVNKALFNQKPNSGHWVYSNEAKMINKLVFGRPDSGQRNNATENQLNLLKTLQKIDVSLINEGVDYFDRMMELEKIRSRMI